MQTQYSHWMQRIKLLVTTVQHLQIQTGKELLFLILKFKKLYERTMEQIISNEALRGKILAFCYILFAGLYQVSRANISWVISIVVGILAALNYLDQIIQRRKKKTNEKTS